MSRFFSAKYASLDAYVPGEQPKDKKYVKLNTNESPFPPSPSVAEAVSREARELMLYSDPESRALTRAVADLYGVDADMVLMTNGSDEILNFAFMAFSDAEHPIAFADVTYGFYPVFAELNAIPCEIIPLRDGFKLDFRDYVGINKNIVIANPNAPTGIAISLDEIEEIVKSNPENVVIVDEAYVDFGADSATRLTKKYDNIIVTMTFSKSRSMAGARLGFGIASPELIRDMNIIKYSTNPYNVNRLSAVAGIAAIRDNSYYMNNAKIIAENREYTRERLQSLGFEVLPSLANFLFARTPLVSGEELYTGLKERGILVRHFAKERIKEYNRITIGRREDMDTLISAIEDILKEKRK